MTTEKRDGPPSSEDKIRQAKKALQSDKNVSSSIDRRDGSLDDNRRVSAPQTLERLDQTVAIPRVQASNSGEPSPRRWVAILALSAGLVFLLLALLFAVVLIDGLRNGDTEVTGNIAGFLIILGLTVPPGALLATYGLRRQVASRTSPPAISRRIRWPRLIVVALVGTPTVIAVYTLVGDILDLSYRIAGIAVTVVVAALAKLAVDWVLD